MINIMNHYPERTESVTSELAKTDLHYQFVNIKEHCEPYISLFLTVQQIIKNNYENNYTIIVEDDLQLNEPLNAEILRGLIEEAVKVEADVLLLGVITCNSAGISGTSLAKCHSFNGTVFTVYFKKMYDAILKKQPSLHLDTYLSYSNLKIVMAVPEIASQKLFERRICRNAEMITNGKKIII
jgi:hypothetical protein